MSTQSRRRSDKILSMPASGSMTAVPVAVTAGVPDDDVAARAFELYCARGREHGHDLDDWLEAERELRGTATTTAA